MATHLIRGLTNIRPDQKRGVLTIGNFDGVHLGHQQLISSTVALARKKNAPALVITFEPHPFEFFQQDRLTIPRITRLREKFLSIAKLGVDAVIVLPFNQALADLTASQFCDLLATHLQPKHILIGEDFHFGKNRVGDISALKAFGFDVSAEPTFMLHGEKVSSTRVRQALGDGNLQLAQQLLGSPYMMQGRIRPGAALGRQWGFPTANLYLHRKLTPLTGVFTVYMHDIASKPLPGVANLGVRPTVDGTRTLLEVHLLNFDAQIYGRYVRVEFCEKLREEIRYPDIELLKQQIAIDVRDAQNYFKKQGVL